MGKKGKKKTVASTKKVIKTPEQLEQEKQDKKLLKRIFKGGRKKAPKIEYPPIPFLDEEEEKSIEKSSKDLKREEKQAAEEKKAQHKEAEKTARLEHQKQYELKKEEEAKVKAEAKEARMEEKHEAKKEKKIRSVALDDNQKKKLKGAAMVVLGVFMLGFVSYFLYTRLFRAESLAHLLPAGSTIGFAEVNIDGESDQVRKFTKLFEKYPVYQPANIALLANLILPVDYKNEVEPWIGRKIGVVLMKQLQEENSVKIVFFIENKDSEKALNFLKSRVLANSGDELIEETYNGYKLYHYKTSQNYYFGFMNKYVVLTGNDILLKQIIDAQSDPNTLQNDPTFQKVNNNLPPAGLVFGYMDSQKLFQTMLKNPMFQGQKVKELLALQPFMKIFSAEGFNIVANEKDLAIQTFEAIDRSQLQGETYLTYSEKYEGKLLELASESSILFAGGHDLYKEIKRLGEIFSNGASIDATIFNGIMEAQKDKYFGKEISLESDIYPLLKNEYLLTVENNFEQPSFSLFINLTNNNDDHTRIEKLAAAFVKKRAIFSPQVREVTLQDGTKGQEIVASAEDISRSDTSYNGYNITTLKLGNLPWSINYTVLDNTFVLSTNPMALNTIIDRKAGKITTNLRVSDGFNRVVMPVMRTADEIFHVKLGAIVPVLGLDQNPAVKPYVEGFNSLTMAKNFFDDGISTIYVIDIL